MHHWHSGTGHPQPSRRAAIWAAVGVVAAVVVAGCQSQSVALNPNSLRSLSWSQTLAGSCAGDLPVAVVVVNADGAMVGSSIVGRGKDSLAAPGAAASGTIPASAAATATRSSAACTISTVVPVSRASTRYWVGVTAHTTVIIPPPNGGGGLGQVYGPFTSLAGVLTPPRGQ